MLMISTRSANPRPSSSSRKSLVAYRRPSRGCAKVSCVDSSGTDYTGTELVIKRADLDVGSQPSRHVPAAIRTCNSRLGGNLG